MGPFAASPSGCPVLVLDGQQLVETGDLQHIASVCLGRAKHDAARPPRGVRAIRLHENFEPWESIKVISARSRTTRPPSSRAAPTACISWGAVERSTSPNTA